MQRAASWLALIAACAAGCDTASTPPPTDAWVGRWSGPEGTYLEITGDGGVYEITVKDLDAARTFQGKAAGDRIVFLRGGTTESLRATNGDETGMKWLAGKSNCLTIKLGEGFCKDDHFDGRSQ